jgi:hypothetical protein
MEIRCGIKKTGDEKKKYVHMLNATLCATGRAICCLLENYQQHDGVRIPEVLVPFMGGITFLPFVRELKGKLRDDKKAAAPVLKVVIKTEEKPTATKSIAASTPTPVSASSGNAEVDELVIKIVDAGNSVRDLKATKASKEQVQAAVADLLALKVAYKALTGTEYGGAEAKPAKSEEKVAVKAKEVKKPAEVTPTVPIPETTPAPAPRSGSAPTTVWKTENKEVDLLKLDAKLATLSYIAGYSPSAQDSAVFAALLQARVNAEDLKPNAQRWFRHIGSYSVQERAAWK